jgi:hypothetical protein
MDLHGLLPRLPTIYFLFLVWSRRQRMERDFANDNRLGVVRP